MGRGKGRKFGGEMEEGAGREREGRRFKLEDSFLFIWFVWFVICGHKSGGFLDERIVVRKEKGGERRGGGGRGRKTEGYLLVFADHDCSTIPYICAYCLLVLNRN